MIDGAIIIGSSGTPVVQKPGMTRYVKGNMAIESFPVMVLGVIAEPRYAWTADFQSFAGLGLAFDAETIDLFYA